MTKDRLVFGILGLVIGAVIGFMFANSVNRGGPSEPLSSAPSAANTSANAALPPNHPPIGQSGDPQSNAPIPEVTAAIEKARQQPDNYEAQMTAADLYYQIQRFEEAARFYEAANRLRPQSVEAMIKAGNSRFDAEQFDQAEKWYLAALERKPDDTNVRSDLGLTFFLRTPPDIDRAIKEFNRSLAIDPNHEMTLQNLTIAYREKKDTQNAAATLERLRKINPNNPVVQRAQ